MSPHIPISNVAPGFWAFVRLLLLTVPWLMAGDCEYGLNIASYLNLREEGDEKDM